MARRTFVLLPLALAGLLAPPAAAAPRWDRDRGTGPSARMDSPLASVAGGVYLFGGQRSGRALGDFWRFSAARGRWSRVRGGGERPEPRWGHNLVAEPGGTLLLFGGQSGGRFFDDTWRFEPRSRRWTMLPASGPQARYGAFAAVDPATGRFVVTHGFAVGRFDDTWALDGSTFTDLSGATRPLARCLGYGAIHGDGFFIFGGASDPRPFLGDFWRFDVSTRAWRQLRLGRRPAPRNRYAAAQSGATWILHGGNTTRGLRSDLWRIDLRRPRAFAQVRTSGRKPPVRSSHGAALTANGTLVIFGGTGARGRELGDTWTLRLR